MTSISTRPQTTYPMGYEASQNSKPPRQENMADTSTGVGTQGDSAAPRPPVTPEQRGQFSSHNKIVNPPQSQGVGSQRETLELVNRNTQLLTDFKAFVTECDEKFVELKNDIVELRKQLSTSPKDADETPVELPQTPEEPVEQVTQDAQTTEVNQDQDLEEALKLNTQLRTDISDLMTKLTAAFEELSADLKSMSEQFKKMNKPETQTPTVPTDRSTMTTNDAPADSTDEPPTQAAPTADQFRADNANIEKGIADMKNYYNTQISMLEEQVQLLKKHLSESKR